MFDQSSLRFRVKFTGEAKWKKSLKQFLINSLEIVGKIKGIPIHTVRRILESVIARPEVTGPLLRGTIPGFVVEEVLPKMTRIEKRD